MPRYFFHVRDSRDVPDEDGVVLKDPEEACAQAVVAVGEALKDLDGRFWDSSDWSMHVIDEQGATVCTLSFRGTKGGPTF